MLSDQYITYLDDKDALQTWLAANVDKYPKHIFQAYTAVHAAAQGDNFIFVGLDRFETVKSEDSTKTLTFIKIRNLEQRDMILASPLQVLGAGICGDGDNCPYKKIMDDPDKLAKFREVISEERQTEEFGGFSFCVI